jgi:hypothetical protein
MSESDFDGAVEAYRQALDPFVRGDPEPVSEPYSRRDDVTLANALGPPRLGWAEVKKAIEEATANFTGALFVSRRSRDTRRLTSATSSGLSATRFSWRVPRR